MTKLLRGLFRRLHGQRRDREKAVGTSLGQLGELLVLNAGKRRRERRRLRVDEGLRANREHLNVDLGCRHVLQAALHIPAATGEMPVDVAGDIEGGEEIGRASCRERWESTGAG